MNNFRDIPGFEGLYQVNNRGDVISIYYNKGVTNLKKKDNNGYICYRLYKDKKQYKILAHRAVAITFIDNPEGKPFINHKNGKTNDNNLENLEWCTPSENTIHSYVVLGREGIWKGKLGKEHNRSREILQYTIDGINFIKKWDNAVEINKYLGYDKSTIGRCCLGKYKFAYGSQWKYTD